MPGTAFQCVQETHILHQNLIPLNGRRVVGQFFQSSALRYLKRNARQNSAQQLTWVQHCGANHQARSGSGAFLSLGN